ncbi:MAG: D-glycerate dehydrogenase [Alphaproteobacteria bacterium]
MSLNRPKIVVTRKLPDLIEQRLAELFDATLNPSDMPLSQDALIKAVQSADMLVPTVTDDINAAVLNAAGPQLKLIANFGAGTDHIDIPAAHDKGIIVTNTPSVLTEDTADLTMTLILAVPRRLSEGVRLLRNGEWAGWAPTGMLGHRIGGKKLGIIGMGRIGLAVAQRAHAFGMDIHYHNRDRLPAQIEDTVYATFWDDLDKMLADMDIVSINCPLTPGTHHLISAERLKLMQPHAYLVNTSRGEVIDEQALTAALIDGTIAGAGLDVFEREPEVDEKLRLLNNVTLLPHMGSATLEGRIDMGNRVLINMKTYVDGHRPPDRVLPE